MLQLSSSYESKQKLHKNDENKIDLMKSYKNITFTPMNFKNIASTKTKMAAWFVSNCFAHSRREKYVKALQTFLQVKLFLLIKNNKFILFMNYKGFL